MQALIEMIVGVIAMLAAAALSLFGLQLDAPDKPQREIHRVHDCGDQPPAAIAAAAERQQNC